MSESPLTMEGVLADRSAWEVRDCPVAAALGVVGTRSAILIMREVYYGTRRFDDFATRVGLSEPVAAARLRELTDAGLLQRVPYREPGQRTRYEYGLTPMGRDLAPVVLGLYEWGGKYLSPQGAPRLEMTHLDCGAEVHTAVACENGHPVPLREIAVRVRRRGQTGSTATD
jgi:DNA-binding HxlR family transcriptional regulator